MSGFTTPPSGPVRTELGIVAYDGDESAGSNDALRLNNRILSNALNPATDDFNSTITRDGVDLGGRNPNYVNQLGFDADMFNADGSSNSARRAGWPWADQR